MRNQLKDYESQTQDFEKQLQNTKMKLNISETYFKMSRQYNEVKEQSHNEALELDRLKTQEAHIKDEHEEFEFEKNDGYQSENSRITLTENKSD